MGHWRFCLDAIAAVRVVRLLVALPLIVSMKEGGLSMGWVLRR